ncbi:MAG: hypothetical protein JWP11_694 [Frankiales bacterium]|nr:hypothetical protein [Frankiales bacterium]
MRRTLLALVALLILGVTACGGEKAAQQPPVSSFADGTCRIAAPDVLAIGKAGESLGSGRTISAGAKTSIRDAQQGLRTVAEGAEPAYKPALEALAVSAGFVRIRADGNTYEPQLGRQLMTDYAAVLKACRAS